MEMCTRRVAVWSLLTILALMLGVVDGPDGAPPVSAAQRCAGTLDYVVRDESGRIMSAANVSIVSVAYCAFQRMSNRFPSAAISRHDEAERFDPAAETIMFSTECGKPFVHVELEYNGMRMYLVFKNVPSELNFYVDSLPFQEGRFQIDLEPNGPSYDEHRTPPMVQIPDMILLTAKERNESPYFRGLVDRPVVSSENWKVLEIE